MGDVGVESSGRRVGREEERAFLHFGRAFSVPDPASFSAERLSAAEKAAEEVLDSIHPTLDSEETRRDVIDHLQRLFETNLNCEVFPYGSVPLKTYLPDGDIDLTVLKGPTTEDLLAHDVLAILHGEEQNEYAEYQINDTQFIDAEVKIVKCLVQNIVIDISFNQIGGLSALCFLEQVDRLVGKNHLFKRSILLIKTWCFYESRILGATHGLISTYALETLIIYIFQLFHSSLGGPLATLYRFLDYFSQFDWDNYCISLKGPVCKSSLPDVVVKLPGSGSIDLLLDEDFMENCMDMFQVPFRWLQSNQKAFQLKHINIIDPLKENNNLGRSVHRGNSFRIRSAFRFGARRLGHVLSLPGDQVADEINKFFSNTISRHKKRSSPSIDHHLAPVFGDDASSTSSLSSHFDLVSEDDLLLKPYISDFDDDSFRMGEKSVFLSEKSVFLSEKSVFLSEKSVFLSENKPERRRLSRDEYSDVASGNLCDKLNSILSKQPSQNVMDSNVWSTSSPDLTGSGHLKSISNDFRGMNERSIGRESDALDPLADLSGDYDSHIRSFLYGPLSHGFPSSSSFPSYAPTSVYCPATPSSIQNMQYNSIHQLPFNQDYIFSMNSYALTVGQTVYPVHDSAWPIGAFPYDGKSSARGTGTYFPPTIVNSFYREPPSMQGRGRRKAPGTRNQIHRYHSGNTLNQAVNLSNSFEKNFGEAMHADNMVQGQCTPGGRAQSFSAGDANRANGLSRSSSLKIEFGSVGNLGEEVIASSKHVRGSNQCGLIMGNTGLSCHSEAKKVRKAVDAP